VIHRDIKPENCYITRDGTLKVMDFGIAKLQAATGVTATGMIAGTAAYMAPEQAMNFRGVTASADVYSLGVVAYELFTGSLPFQHPEMMPLLLMHSRDTPPPPRARNPAIPEALEKVVLRCLEKEPGRRFASCRELAGRLAEIRGRH
jgi:serine/threonine-protein kinase